MEKNNVGVRKGGWTKDEDNLLKTCIEKYGEGHWHKVPLRAGLNRCRKSCRLRWLNYLRPNIKRGYFMKDEVDLIVRLHKLLGNRWSLIAGRLPGRTANDVKNFWNTHIAKKKSVEAGKKTPPKTISKSSIIKPQPRTFSKLHLRPMLSNEQNKTEEENLNVQNQTSLGEEPDGLIKSAEASRSNQPFPLSEEEVDDCIQWWGNLLEITESGDGGCMPFSSGDDSGMQMQGIISPDRLCGPANIDDVWGLDNIYLPQ